MVHTRATDTGTHARDQSQHALAPHDITHTPQWHRKLGEKWGDRQTFSSLLARPITHKSVFGFLAPSPCLLIQVFDLPHSTFHSLLFCFFPLFFLVNFCSPYMFFLGHVWERASASNCYNGPGIFMCLCAVVLVFCCACVRQLFAYFTMRNSEVEGARVSASGGFNIPSQTALVGGFLLQLATAIIAAYLHSFWAQVLVASN